MRKITQIICMLSIVISMISWNVSLIFAEDNEIKVIKMEIIEEPIGIEEHYATGDIVFVGGIIRVYFEDDSYKDISMNDCYQGFIEERWALFCYGDVTITYDIYDYLHQVESISVIQLPNVTIHDSNNKEIDLTGGILLINYAFGLQEKVSLTEATVVEFDHKKLGLQTITLSYKGVTTTFTIQVVDFGISDISSIEIKDKTVNIDITETYQLKATVYPENIEEDKMITWSSSNDKVLTVDENGLLTPLRVGKVQVIATASNGMISVCNVKISAKDFVINDNGVLMAYTGNAEHVVIPEGIRAIRDGATHSLTEQGVFSRNTFIKSVVLPSTMTYIGMCAFEYSSLQEVVIPYGVVEIGTNAFGYTDLRELELPNSIKIIGSGAFNYALMGCEKLVIPESVDIIGVSAFQGANGVKKLVLPSSMKEIYGLRFRVPNAIEIIIPNGVEVIHGNAFYNCNSLKSMIIPDTVSLIGSRAFIYCNSLEYLELPGSVKEIDALAFWGHNLREVYIPEGVEKIGAGAFNGLQLKNIYLPKSISKIEYSFTEKDINNQTEITNNYHPWNEKATVHVYEGSYAHKYCVKNGYKYVLRKEVSLVNDNIILKEGTELKQNLWLKLDSNVSIDELQFSSSNSDIANVDENGNIYGLSVGKAEITVKIGDKVLVTCTVNVVKPITSIALDVNSVDLLYGETVTLKTSILPLDTTDSKTITWTSSDKNVATVDKTGKVTTKGPGTATITAKTVNGLTATCVVTVKLQDVTTKVARASDTSLKVSWNKVNGATGYEVYRSTTIDGTYKKVGTITKGTTTSYTNSKLTNGTTYFYKVRAYRTVNGKKLYGEYSDVVGYAALKTPTVTVKRNSYDSITVSWKAVAKAEAYEVYRSTNKDKNYELVTTVTDLSYVDTNLLTAKTYYYKVKAVKDCTTGNAVGAFSTVQSARTTLTTPKVTITNPNFKTINLTWSAINGADGYEVLRATKKDGKYTVVGTVDTASYEDTNVKLGTTYYYKVRGYHNNEDGSKGYSSYSTIVNKKVAIVTPKVTVTNPSHEKNVLDWQDIALSKEYQVYRATSKSGKYTKVATVTTSDYEDTNIVIGKTYYYKVRAVVDVNGTDKYSSYSSVVSKKVVLPKPTNAVVTRLDSKTAVITFDSVYGAEGYEIYRATSKTGKFSKITTVTETSYTNTKLSNKTYYYKVRAYRMVGKTKVYSSYSSVITCKK